MKSFALSGRRTPAVALLAALAGSLAATSANAGFAGVTVRAEFLAGSIGFNHIDPPVYVLSAQLDASGFTDDSNLDNFVQVQTSSFQSTWYPAAMHGSPGDGSGGYTSLADLNTGINDPATTLTLFDGVTGLTSRYRLNLATPGFTNDHIRPVHIDGLSENSVISDSPTFMFSQPAAMDPMNANTNLFVGLLANNPANNTFTPGVMLGDTSWSPTAPLAPDTYALLVITQNKAVDQGLISFGSPVLIDGPDTLQTEGLSSSLFIQTSDQRLQLSVVPAPGAAALLGIGGLIAARRRRV